MQETDGLQVRLDSAAQVVAQLPSALCVRPGGNPLLSLVRVYMLSCFGSGNGGGITVVWFVVFECVSFGDHHPPAS